MNYLVMDLEMTGLEPGWHEIIQIGAVLYNDNWEELGRFLTNVYPENEESYSIPALEVHGLTWEELEDAPMMNEVLPKFENWILETQGISPKHADGRQKSQALRDTVICGQSVINDINFLKFAYKDEHLKWPFNFTLVDLHTLTFFLFPILERAGQKVPQRRSLEAVAGFFGYSRESEEHNALEDSVLTGLCLREVFRLGAQLNLPT
ncbi:3'-5' exonuclease [Pontibacter sp. G13]|uniref:3'-5' exonuclease n=1 Tax=Pontibacter sp. G13 TaxID=3074898 RepID=UPI00288A01B3|nr:3'-5' exonuclease [Pontibacter sp. G13]WNJ15909.1 3'-5' exonuclease [Pontibacter sp. G13]